MKSLSFNLNSAKNGGKITAFNYSHGLNELCGSWSAQAVNGSFIAGNSISFDGVMTNGIISKAQKDSSGLWHIEGYDAGVRLMKSTPEIEDLPTGNAKTVIQYLASFCGISLNMSTNGLSDFNVRSVVSGSTCAEAILELAMFSGLVAFIGNDGVLNIIAPANNSNPSFDNVIDDSGSDFDLDGYATQVTILLRKSSVENNDDDSSDGTVYYTGKTPSTSPEKKTYSGSFSNGSYSVTMLEPFGVPETEETEITQNDITIHTVQSHTYDYKHKTIWRDNQEYVLFAFIETGYTLTKTTTGTYSTEKNGDLTFSETTTETMSRSLSPFDAISVPDDWKGQIDMIDSETIERSTVREGGKAPDDNMPTYSPPFDSKITRKYSRELRGKGLLCNEIEKRYEARQVGTISPVKVNGELIPHFMLGSNLAIQTHSTPEWVEVDTYRTYYEQYNKNGECVVSTRSEYSDDGSKWLAEHTLSDTGDEDLNEYQKAYTKFSQASNGLEVSIGTSVLTSAWHFLELQGRMKNTTGDDEEGAVLGNVDDWFNNGAYISTEVCPHYNNSADTCNAFALVDAGEGNECYRYNSNYRWHSCPRAQKALTLAREQEKQQLDAPIIGTASLSGNSSRSPSVGYKREIYIDDDIPDETAQTIADNIAANIITVKGIKGLRKTVTIPYSPSYVPNGSIVQVSHDWENLQSQVTYRFEGTIPDFLVAQSVSGIAAFVSARDTSRLSVPKYGVVISIQDNNASVKINNSTVNCTTKLKNLGTGDTVLVSFPSGNKLRGQVIARL
ncbi:MAG: hypothetical protein IJ587_00390 [Synergistaceae bacterium]|nr:hypothetical protein [Synergistaceae bacterium]